MSTLRSLRDQTALLPGGRVLGYDDLGPADAPVVLYFHGVPGSRRDAGVWSAARAAEKAGVRVVAVDRPGCGASTFVRGRRVTDWPADVIALADRLKIERFAVLGWSGGAPYALACGAQPYDRVLRVGVVSGVGRLDQPEMRIGLNPTTGRFFRLNHERPRIGRLLDWSMALGARRGPQRLLTQSRAALPEPDRDVLLDPDAGAAYVAAISECFRSGTRGGQLDTSLAVGTWGFEPEQVTTPVLVWHGRLDVNAPVAVAERLARRLPAATLSVHDGEGHLSVLCTHAVRILADLTAAASRG